MKIFSFISQLHLLHFWLLNFSHSKRGYNARRQLQCTYLRIPCFYAYFCVCIGNLCIIFAVLYSRVHNCEKITGADVVFGWGKGGGGRNDDVFYVCRFAWTRTCRWANNERVVVRHASTQGPSPQYSCVGQVLFSFLLWGDLEVISSHFMCTSLFTSHPASACIIFLSFQRFLFPPSSSLYSWFVYPRFNEHVFWFSMRILINILRELWISYGSSYRNFSNT